MILSKGDYSIFFWEHDESQNLIPHRYEFPIPIMAVTERGNHMEKFVRGSDEAFLDSVVLFSDETPLSDFMQPNDLDESEI